jgi:mono/diheme cytochrome c family protein
VHRATLLLTAACFTLALSCGKKPPPGPGPAAAASAAAAVNLPEPDEPPGDAGRGKALLEQFECNRCHEGTGLAAPRMDKQCFGCHVKILEGTFRGPRGSEARWHDRVVGLDTLPSLFATQKRFRRTFLARFLLQPFDLRPRLGPTMPRLALSPEQARDLATYLAGPDDPAAPKLDLTGADPARGRKLMELRACASCHVFTGVPALMGATPIDPNERKIAAGLALAPDLRFARERLRPEALLAWITSPRSVKPDTAMPDFDLPPTDARDIAAYILGAELAPPEARPVPARLPVLQRKVGYDEVSEKVLRRTCWHCHGEPDYAQGDGGPGNTGGLGFKGRGINFLSYESTQSGRLDDANERHSLFEKATDGTPRLVLSLLLRRDEEAGHPDAQIRGMPLGYPSLTPEEIQLVESWIAQGRPR